MKRKLCLHLLVLLAFGLWSCGSKEKKGNEDDFNKAKESLEDDIKGVIYNIPKTSEIPYLLMSSGAEFNPSLVNDRKKADSYASQNDKAAINLGIYASDIAYLSSYDKTQESMDYLNTCKDLADKLGLLSTFGVDLIERFEDNIGNKDSLASILDETIKQSDEYLKKDNQSKLSALLVTGSFVEGLYIGTTLVNTYPKDLPAENRATILNNLISVILNQESSVTEVIKMLESVPQEGMLPGLLESFKKLQSSYTALNVAEKKKTNTGKLVFSEKDLVDVSANIQKIRGDIVQ